MNYIFEEEGNKYRSVGITHDDTTWDNKKRRRRSNMPLQQNPQRGKTSPSYIRYGIITDKKNNYSRHTARNFRFSSSDYKNVKSKIRNYKNKRRK